MPRSIGLNHRPINSDVIHLCNNDQNILSSEGSLTFPPVDNSPKVNTILISLISLPIPELPRCEIIQYMLFGVLFLSKVLTFNDHFILSLTKLPDALPYFPKLLLSN